MVATSATSDPIAARPPGEPHLRTLGPCRLEVRGSAVAVGGPRQRAVLLRLAVAVGQVVTADRLLEDLWGDEPPPSATGTLQGYLSRLRSALDDPSLIRREGPGYVLDLTDDQVDHRRFARLLDAGRAAADQERALVLLDSALATWSGPALADVADTEWARPFAVALEERRLEALEARFDVLLGLGRHQSAVSDLEKTVTDHPYRERFTTQLMLALYRSGRQAEALRAAERARRTLRDDAGLEPSPELVSLESAILDHDPSIQAAAPAASAAPTAPPLVSTPAVVAAEQTGPPLPLALRRHASRPFVGRAEALATLRSRWERAVAGERRVVLIEGEAGAGKSRLAARLATEIDGAGGVVLWGRIAEESTVPYGPVVDALRHYANTDDTPASAAGALDALAPFVGGEERGDVDGGSGAARHVLFEALAEQLELESRRAPVLYVLDDLQWADLPTLRLVEHVMEHPRPLRLMVVATMRTVPTPDRPGLQAFLGGLARDRLLDRVALTGLTEPEVGELLASSGSDVAADLVGAVHEATGGNPFFVSEVAEHGDLATVPATVRDVLGARLVRLGADTVRLLGTAAVAGPSAPLPVLAAATGLHGVAVVDAVDEAVAAGFLSEEGDAGQVVFRHGLVQQVVVDRMSATRRRAVHLAVADALTDAGAGRPDLAHHLLEAGSLVAADRAAGAAVEAGRDAMSLFAYEVAEGWAERALAVEGLTDPVLRSRALVLCSEAERALGDRVGARVSAEAATDAARLSGDPVVVASAAEALALARAGLGFDFNTEDPELQELLAEALAGLAGSIPTEGGPAGVPGREQALAVAEANGHHALVATVHLARRMAIWRLDLLDERLETDALALAAAARAGQLPLRLTAGLYLVADLTEAGRVKEAEAHLEEVQRLADRVRQPMYDAFVHFMEAQQALVRGAYAECAHLADVALTEGAQSHGPNAELAWSGLLFIRSWDQGQLRGLSGVLATAAAALPQTSAFLVAEAMCLVAEGRSNEVRERLPDLLRTCLLDANRDSLWMASGGVLAELARELEHPEVAATVLEALQPYHGRIVVTGLGRASLGPVDRFIGVAAAAVGDLDAAIGWAEAAEAQARADGAVVHEARAAHDRAWALSRRGGPGDAEDAAVARQRAQQLAQQLAEPLGLVLGPVASQG